jgi:type IV secretory pathway TrbD component
MKRAAAGFGERLHIWIVELLTQVLGSRHRPIFSYVGKRALPSLK